MIEPTTTRRVGREVVVSREFAGRSTFLEVWDLVHRALTQDYDLRAAAYLDRGYRLGKMEFYLELGDGGADDLIFGYRSEVTR